MNDKELLKAFIASVNAEEKAAKEYERKGTWHVDICCCPRCKALGTWIYDLTSKQKWRAKWLFFKKYILE